MIPIAVPSNYDAVTLNHWLWWKHRCHEGSPEDFQRLFEDVLKREDPRFMQIRPYGNIGDRKCDGLYFQDGMVFQVYSPDELKQSETQAKIEEDLAGAVGHWTERGLKKWVFVYNCRRGLPPDIPGTLAAEQKKYPWLEIDHLSSDALWERARALTLQQRCEILGAPLGYEHLFRLPDASAGDAATRLQAGCFVVVHDVLTPISIEGALEALKPGVPFGPPISIRPRRVSGSWDEAALYQRTLVDDALRKGRDLVPRFAVFSLAPVPLAIHLGFCFSDRVELRAFQYDRDAQTWCWPASSSAADTGFQVTGLPVEAMGDAVDVVLRISLSARVDLTDALASAPEPRVVVDIAAAQPSVTWLQRQEQLTEFGKLVRGVLQALREKVPRCRSLHVFAAVPTGAAIAFGQAINPRMNPAVTLYEFSMQKEPRYEAVLRLTDATP